MRSAMIATILMAALTASVAVGQVIDGTNASEFSAATGWVARAPTAYDLTEVDGNLRFTVEGAGSEMPWLIDLRNKGLTGDEHYLLTRYRAGGMATDSGIYFIHGEEGTRGGLAYAMADDLRPDGEWHTLAVDMAAINPAETTHHLAVKVFADDAGSAWLEIERIWSAEEIPGDALLARVPPQRAVRSVTLDWTATEAAPQIGWTQAPASDFAATVEDDAMVFRVTGQGLGMRWLSELSEPVDLAQMIYMSLRYRATGQLGTGTYAVWLGNRAEGTGGSSAIGLPASAIKADGAWHNLTITMRQDFAATHLAVGLDSAGPEATMALSAVTFSTRPRQWTMAEALSYQARDEAWAAGQGGFTSSTAAPVGGGTSAFLTKRLELSDWFSASHITVGGVPFEVTTDPALVLHTATADLDTQSLALPPDATEVYLLTAAALPATEPWGLNWRVPRPVEVLDVPEKVYYEIRYADGPADRVLPLDATSGQWGMKRGLSVNVVHPDPARQATELVLHDRMQTASFAILGTTHRTDQPRIAEPGWDHLTFGSATDKPDTPATWQPEAGITVRAGALQAIFDTSDGLSWSGPHVAAKLGCEVGPVFEVSVGGETLAAAEWTVDATETIGAGQVFTMRHAASGLAARVQCTPGAEGELVLGCTLTNEGDARTTATLHFPVVRGLNWGTAGDTSYLCGKRGGLINSAPLSCREPLGERHPMQLDGFFSPERGLALACLTHDTVGQHHFRNFAKSAEGGAWSAEYVQRDLAPGESFEATEAAMVLREGDWRAIFGAYTDWLGTWFEPASPYKPWFDRIFAALATNVHYNAVAEPEKRGDVQRLIDTMMEYIGICDTVHLFGWGASEEFGEWGDYGHYEEVGGREYFRDNIDRVQQAGIPVSLYLDAYLSSAKGENAGDHAEEWAMKRADGSAQLVPAYDAYNQCPYMEGWQDYLAGAFARVKRDLGPQILYIDEYGATDGRWICHAKDHGHNGYEIPYAGEVATLAKIREAVGPEVALYTEYSPAEASRVYIDGSISYQALWSADSEALAPHFIDLPRFAFPHFKQFHIIHYARLYAGNWWLHKFPFFNGEVFRVGRPNLLGMDGPSLEFLRRAIAVQCAHRDAFASENVQPLVATEVSGVFANLFAAPAENVWTLYNANGRSVRTPVLRVKHAAGATYTDAWSGDALEPEIRDGEAWLAVDLGPKGVGCVVQELR